LQVVPEVTGQTVNFGASMYRADVTWARTETAVLAAFVLHTQITKLATWPALTSAELEKGWTRTHNCGVVLAGGDVDGEPLGVGDGLGDVVALALGLGLGLELAEFSVDVGLGLGLGEVADGDGDEVSEVDALGLDAGLLAGSLPEADALGEADWLVLAASAVLAGLLGDAAVLAEELPELEELLAADELEPARLAALSDVAVLLPLAGLVALLAADAVSTASFGREAHAVVTIRACVVVTARASPNRLKPRKKNPASAPSAAGLRIRALTCATSLQ